MCVCVGADDQGASGALQERCGRRRAQAVARVSGASIVSHYSHLRVDLFIFVIKSFLFFLLLLFLFLLLICGFLALFFLFFTFVLLIHRLGMLLIVYIDAQENFALVAACFQGTSRFAKLVSVKVKATLI